MSQWRCTCIGAPVTYRPRSVCLSRITAVNEVAARAAAMQIAAMRPQYVSRDDVPADVIDNERRIAEATAREEGKPEAALPKDRRRSRHRFLQAGDSA